SSPGVRERSAARCRARAAAATSCCSRATIASIASPRCSRRTAVRSCRSSSSRAGSRRGRPRGRGEMRIALVGPLAPWRGGLAQYLALLGEALSREADVLGVTFTRQYPGFLFPGQSQLDPAAERPGFRSDALLDSILPPSWKRTAKHLERFA